MRRLDPDFFLGSGQHFDPDVVAAFDSHFEQFVAIAERYQDDSEATHG